MKIIFVGLYYFGFWHGWAMETKVFPNGEECADYQVMMTEYAKAHDAIKGYELTCHFPTIDGDTGSVTVSK